MKKGNVRICNSGAFMLTTATMEMQECIYFVLLMHIAVNSIINTERTYMETTIACLRSHYVCH